MPKLEHYRILGYVVTIAMHLVNSIVCDMAFTEEALEHPDVRKMKTLHTCYLTIWNIGFQVMYAALGLYCDIKTLQSSHSQCGYLSNYIQYRRYFLGAVLWPSTVLIFTIFWPTFIYDRNLVYPVFLDSVLSIYSNIVMHAAILPVLLWEVAFLPRKVPKTHKGNLICINIIFVVYISWIVYMNSRHGIWPYPFMNMTEGTIYFPLFFLVVYILIHIHYYTQWILVRRIWGNIQDIKSS